MMATPAPPAGDRDADWRLLADLVEERFGLVFTGARRELLLARLAPRLAALGLRGWFDYYHYLLFHPGRVAEEPHLRQAVTNNETYFFREAHQLELLAGTLAPARLGAPGGRSFRVLSAGCSSGEEPYSIAVTLADAGLAARGLRWQIDGFDLDPARIAQGRAAEYEEGSLRACTPAQRVRLFEPRPGRRWALRPAHRRSVELFEWNLFGPPLEFPRYDVIFCRNVFIYLSDAAMHAAVTRLVGLLADEGVLLLGHAESLIHRRRDVEPVLVGGQVVYRRAGGAVR